jgi:hypothetical protein
MTTVAARHGGRRWAVWLAVLGVLLAAGLLSGTASARTLRRASAGASERPADTGPSGVFNPSNSL